jgi:hypothetical protein
MTTLRILLGLTPVVNPFLDVLDVVDQSRAARLEVSEFVLDPVAGDGSDVLGQAVFGLSNLPIDLAEMKISILALTYSSKQRWLDLTLCRSAPCPVSSYRFPRPSRRGTCRPVQGVSKAGT